MDGLFSWESPHPALEVQSPSHRGDLRRKIADETGTASVLALGSASVCVGGRSFARITKNLH